MPLYTLEEQLRSIRRDVNLSVKLAQDAMRYAETSARLHHEAICRLNQLATGQHRWPSQP
jgi:hypothetical protein